MQMWIVSRGVVLIILLMLGIGFKFEISGFLHHVVTTDSRQNTRLNDNGTSQCKDYTFSTRGLSQSRGLKECLVAVYIEEEGELKKIEPTSWEGVKTQLDTAQEVQNEWKKMKLLQDMQLIQKLRDDQKCMKKVFEDMSEVKRRNPIKAEIIGNIVTDSHVTPSWREIVSLNICKVGVLHMN
ncbi:hypothetical protein Tco_0287507 [Tanacetum coccineum]